MVNLTNLIVALVAPVPVFIGLLFMTWFLKSKLLEIIVALIYFEHLYIGSFLGFEMKSSGGFFPMPYCTSIFIATIIFDYLFLSCLVYAVLTLFSKLSLTNSLE